MEEEIDQFKDLKELKVEIDEIKESGTGFTSTTEALLVMIYQTLDQIRFHNSD